MSFFDELMAMPVPQDRDTARKRARAPWFEADAAVAKGLSKGDEVDVAFIGSGWAPYDNDPAKKPKKVVRYRLTGDWTPRQRWDGRRYVSEDTSERWAEVIPLTGRKQRATIQVDPYQNAVRLIRRDKKGAHTTGSWVHLRAVKAEPTVSMFDELLSLTADAQVRPQPQAQAPPARLRGGSLDDLARQAARRRDGRPSEAVRAWLKTHPQDQDRRGELLARARKAMATVRGAKAHLPPTPRKAQPRAARDHGYQTLDHNEVWQETPLLTMEAFAGGGLLTLASALEGNIEVDGFEIAKPAIATQKRNAGLLRLAHDPNPTEASAWRPSTRTPDGLDLLYGGPPCVWASKGANLGRSEWERGWFSKDNYFPMSLDWICDLQPRVVVWENAPELGESDKYRPWLALWRKQVSALGYDMAVHVLAAADFGNPTMRRRAFVIAWPKGAPWGKHLARAPQGEFARPGSPEVRRGAKMPWKPSLDRLTSGCCGGWGLVDCVFLGNLGAQCRGCGNGRNFVPAPNTGGEQGRIGLKGVVVKKKKGKDEPWHKWICGMVGKRQPRFDKFVPADLAGAWVNVRTEARDLRIPGRRLSEYLSRTVVPNFFNKAEGLIIPADAPAKKYGTSRDWDRGMLEAMKRMSVRDAAKLQDVPQWYGFEGTRPQVFLQLGNGVPVNLGRGVMAHVRMAMGLPVRPPWWETELPVGKPQVAYQTRAQIAAAGSRETRRGPATGHPDGLWPMAAFAMCFASPPMLEEGLVLDEWLVDDWEMMLADGIIGAQEQRRLGKSKLDREAQLLPAGEQLRLRLATAAQTRALFGPDGMDRNALWAAGYRGPPGDPPDQMPHVFSRSYSIDEWHNALVYSEGGPYATLLGAWLRLAWPWEFYYGGDEDWVALFPMDTRLPPGEDVTIGGVKITEALLKKLRAMDAWSKVKDRSYGEIVSRLPIADRFRAQTLKDLQTPT